MKDHPILFSTPMVQAILDGKKTVTRRIVKTQPGHGMYLCCKYSLGDHLWVRESWNYLNATPINGHPQVCYKADDRKDITGSAEGTKAIWRPSIHMPRWASRITLKIINLNCERLHNITEHQAKKEGIVPVDFQANEGELSVGYMVGKDDKKSILYPTAKECFKSLWESINGENSWNINPLVWVIEFNVIDKRINQ